MERTILRKTKQNPKITSSELKAILGEQFDLDIHQETIRRVLRRAGFRSESQGRNQAFHRRTENFD